MIKYISALALAIALSACSGDSSDDDDASPAVDNGANNTGGQTGDTGGTQGGQTGGTSPVVTDGEPIMSDGDIVGAWFGTNNFGEAVMIIDANSNVHSFATDNNGQYQTVFGPASGALQLFSHRDSINPGFDDSFTLSGDLAAEPIAYSLAAQSEGEEIVNTGGVGDFSMTFATENDLPRISLDSVAGNWVARSSFACPPELCNITLNMSFTSAGGVTGSTQFNDNPPLEMSDGTISVAQGGETQYLNISFVWAEQRRTGVVHVDRVDQNRLIINTTGPSETEGVPASFSAILTKNP